MRELRDAIKQSIDYRCFYLRYCRNGRCSGQRLQAHCPLPAHMHSGQGQPSLSVNLQQGLFHCFSRGEGGDAIRFYQLMHSVSYWRAVREIAYELGICKVGRQLSLAFRAAPDKPEEHLQLKPLDTERMQAICETFLDVCRCEEQVEGLSYLARRGINAQTAKQAGVTYFPRAAYQRVMRRMLATFALDELQRSGLFNRRSHLTFYRHRLLFPFYVHNRAVYLQARTTAAGVIPRWHNMRGSIPALYNADQLAHLKSGAPVYLVEGFTDSLTLMTHSFAVVGIVGAGGLKEEWLAALDRFQVVAVLDPDAAGRRAAAKYEEMFARRDMQLTRLHLTSDVCDFFRHHSSAALELALITETLLDSRYQSALK